MNGMQFQPLKTTAKAYYGKAAAWVLRDAHQRKARELKEQARKAFTEHPEETGESYWEHLWFTSKMSLRFIYTTLVLLIHGLFPFLLTRAASQQIETVYKIMKSRIPKTRRDAIDADHDNCC